MTLSQGGLESGAPPGPPCEPYAIWHGCMDAIAARM